MPDPETHGSKNIGFRIIAIAAAGILLSLGVCKAGFIMDRGAGCCGPSTMDILGGFGFVLSLLALGVGVLILIFETLTKWPKRKDK